MNKNWCMGIFAAVVTLAAPILPAKADPIYVKYKSNFQTINTTTWTTVTMDGGINYVPLSLNSRRLVVGRFTSETDCYGTTAAAGHCSVRIMYRNTATGAITEFNPVVGTDFVFDSKDTGNSRQGHAVSRSVLLPAGNYEVYVQGAVTLSAITLRLDDAHFEVELYNP